MLGLAWFGMHVKLNYQVSLLSLGVGGWGWGKSKLKLNPVWAELGNKLNWSKTCGWWYYNIVKKINRQIDICIYKNNLLNTSHQQITMKYDLSCTYLPITITGFFLCHF